MTSKWGATAALYLDKVKEDLNPSAGVKAVDICSLEMVKWCGT